MTAKTPDNLLSKPSLIRQQLDYYRARADEYDEWWLRRGRYDRGEELNSKWFSDAAIVSSALAAFKPTGRVLELACGTGIWTEQLAKFASHVTALDGSPEMLAINQARVGSPSVHYINADLFNWQPSEQFDVVFFGFWLSHVPPERFADFWRLVRSCLSPTGRVFFVDSRYDQTSTAKDHKLPKPDATLMRRRLNDGREFQIYKVFYEPVDLARRLNVLGWDFEVHQTNHYFIYGSGKLRSSYS